MGMLVTRKKQICLGKAINVMVYHTLFGASTRVGRLAF